MQMYASASVAGYAMILVRHVAIIRAKPKLTCGSSIKQKHVWHEDQVMRWWMLHGNVSRKGYGNAFIGRYGGCFEEDIRRFMMTERIMSMVWMHWRSMHQLSR